MIHTAVGKTLAHRKPIVTSPDNNHVRLSSPTHPTIITESARGIVAAAGPENWVPYTKLLQSVFDDIRTARQGQPTVLRAVDIYVPVVAKWEELGITDECTAFQESFTEAVRVAAEAAGVTMVSMYDAFNGPDHDQDPVAAGYIVADGLHLSDKGGVVGGAALAAAGFAPNEAP